jgi:DNA-binding transcriptional regulator YhcF (GntR family)
MYITFRPYLDNLEVQERTKPVEQRRRVPSMDELAHEVGVHPVTFRNIANGNIKQLNLELGGKIITVMRRYGFPMQETDLIRYQPEDTSSTD